MKRIVQAFALAAMCGAAFSAAALEHVVAKVTIVEPTYMPGAVSFMLSAGTATCPAGTWMRWAKDAENNKAVIAALLSAMNAGNHVRFYHQDADKTCTGVFLHVLAN